ncbi:hypothetical protein T492DRAFT_931294 [Pavlovales sp. CCMP2436]|nr:hypothetical protein T492DRAFT_931294 [Pavlovales sp. CCMP2436]
MGDRSISVPRLCVCDSRLFTAMPVHISKPLSNARAVQYASPALLPANGPRRHRERTVTGKCNLTPLLLEGSAFNLAEKLFSPPRVALADYKMTLSRSSRLIMRAVQTPRPLTALSASATSTGGLSARTELLRPQTSIGFNPQKLAFTGGEWPEWKAAVSGSNPPESGSQCLGYFFQYAQVDGLINPNRILMDHVPCGKTRRAPFAFNLNYAPGSVPAAPEGEPPRPPHHLFISTKEQLDHLASRTDSMRRLVPSVDDQMEMYCTSPMRVRSGSSLSPDVRVRLRPQVSDRGTTFLSGTPPWSI